MKAITKLNRNIFVSAVMLISALAGISLPYNSVQADGITIDRNLVISTTVEPGSTFVVNIVFNAPADVFNSIVLHDETPQGWLATGDNNMCLPEAQTSKKYGTGGMEYTWLGPYDAGAEFTAAYQVTVPAGTPEGAYTFPDGSLIYYLGENDYQTVITGDSQIIIDYTLIFGITQEANCDILAGVAVSLYRDDVLELETTSDENGEYSMLLTEAGVYTVSALKEGYKEETRAVEVQNIGEAHEINFTGDNSIIPNEINGVYFAECMNRYLYAACEDAFGGVKFARIMNTYLFGSP